VLYLDEIKNYVRLCGNLAGRPAFSHSGRNEEYYTFPLEISRLSGTIDTINIVCRKDLLETVELTDDHHIKIIGELRTYNNRSGVGNKLMITVFAHEITFTDEPDDNYVMLTGTICKPPNLRKTPLGREICDLMVAVNRRYGRSDYLPCIAWGVLAQASSEYEVGTKINLEGRIQSRIYIKNIDGVSHERTAFEVSVLMITPV
jgi:single-strand DNA-binding protein